MICGNYTCERSGIGSSGIGIREFKALFLGCIESPPLLRSSRRLEAAWIPSPPRPRCSVNTGHTKSHVFAEELHSVTRPRANTILTTVFGCKLGRCLEWSKDPCSYWWSDCMTIFRIQGNLEPRHFRNRDHNLPHNFPLT